MLQAGAAKAKAQRSMDMRNFFGQLISKAFFFLCDSDEDSDSDDDNDE
jgi:hypothetical protein